MQKYFLGTFLPIIGAIIFLFGCDINNKSENNKNETGCLGSPCFQPSETWEYHYKGSALHWFSDTCLFKFHGSVTFLFESKKKVAEDSFEIIAKWNSVDSVSKCDGPWVETKRDSMIKYFEGRSGLTTYQQEPIQYNEDTSSLKKSVFFKKILPQDSVSSCENNGIKYSCVKGNIDDIGITSHFEKDTLYFNGVGLIYRVFASGGHGVISNEDTTYLVLHNDEKFNPVKLF